MPPRPTDAPSNAVHGTGIVYGLLEYLKGKSCVDCGEADPIVLEFDHVGGGSKLFALGEMRLHAWSTIEKELRKCAVRCANGHRRKTARAFGWYRAKAEALMHPSEQLSP